jgi:hypothetical protein
MRRTEDNRKDSVVKREIFEAQVMNNYSMAFVLEDRTQVSKCGEMSSNWFARRWLTVTSEVRAEPAC